MHLLVHCVWSGDEMKQFNAKPNLQSEMKAVFTVLGMTDGWCLHSTCTCSHLEQFAA